MAEALPTYRTETAPDGKTYYYCVYCEDAGTSHVATDLELFTFHMQQRHDGRMVEAQDSEPAPAPGDPSPTPSPVPPDPPPNDPPDHPAPEEGEKEPAQSGA